jgi:nucleoside-triphosphatase THEP1
MHVIITGGVQSGKSTLAAGLVSFLKDRGVPIAGILATGLWKENQRHGFDLTDLKTGVTTPLARRVGHQENSAITPFEFFDKGMAAGQRALDAEGCAHARMIMVDEVGKLELMDRGWAPFLKALVLIPGAVHVWVVRDNLVEAVCHRWHLDRVDIVHVSDTAALERLKRLCVKEQQ